MLDPSDAGWPARVADLVDSCPFDDTRVLDVSCPARLVPAAAVGEVEQACVARGWEVLDLSGPLEEALRARRPARSMVALVTGPEPRPWLRLLLAAASHPLLLAVVVFERPAANAWCSDGIGACRESYVQPSAETLVAAESAGAYGAVSPSTRRSALAIRAGAGWHARRGDHQAAARRFHEAAEVALDRGAWHESIRAGRRALEAWEGAAEIAGALGTATLVSRAALEAGHVRRALQVATVVLAVARRIQLSSGWLEAAALCLAEVAESRGSYPEAEGWLRKGAPQTSPRALALRMRLAMAAMDWTAAARAAHAAARAHTGDAAGAEAQATAAVVFAGLGDAQRCVEALRQARRAVARSPNRSHRAHIAALCHVIAKRHGRRFVPLRLVASSGGPPRALSPRGRLLVTRLSVDAEGSARRSGRIVSRTGQSQWEPMVIKEIIALLTICHAPQEERELADRVCRHLRDLWRASGVGLWLRDSWDAPAVGVGRPTMGRAFVERVSALDWPVGPEPERVPLDGVPSDAEATQVAEAAAHVAGVAIRYAGTVEGVLAVRWSSAPVVADDHVTAILAASAAAMGSAVVALGDRGRVPLECSSEDAVGLVGSSAPMARLREHVRRAASSPFPVLVLGESGSGKELVARAIHHASNRRTRRFCAINCAALTDELFDAELFGHVRGAFTGATHERRGLFEDADGGSLFLDEVGELSARGQAKLLRVLQEREVRRIGENGARRVDVRIIAATNRDLGAAVREGTFRLDLLYRMDVVRIEVPPLRTRGADVVSLAHVFWRDAARRMETNATLGADVVAALARYHWPGNVRELQNVMTALAVSAPRRGRVSVRHLPSVIGGQTPERVLSLAEARLRFDRDYVRRALQQAGGSRSAAARLLGITRQGLAKIVDKHRRAEGVAPGGDEAPESTVEPS